MISTKEKIIEGLEEVEKKYNLFLIDLWGVIHNGIKIFPDVIDVLKKLKEKEKEVLFITNAPRRSSVIKTQLQEFGLNNIYYRDVVSSGEVSWINMKDQIKNSQKTLNCYHIGPPRDFHLTQGLKLNIVKQYENVDFILNTGPWGDNDILENYQKTLEILNKYKVPMICSNPDKKVIRGESFMICAGLLADYYEKIGGRVEYFGKPFQKIYEECYKISNEDDKNNMLVIGDSIENDIKGANNQGLNSLLITSGIHRSVNNNKNNIDIEKINDLMTREKVFADFIMSKFIW